MKTFHCCVSFFIIIFLVACNPDNGSSKRNELPIHIDLTKYETKDLFLSDFVEDISYVKLEKHPECLLGEFATIYKSPNGFIINSFSHQELAVFSEDGRFLNKIGKIGNGPEEYRYTNEVYVQFATKSVVFKKDQSSIFYQFDLSGELIRTLSFQENMSNNGIKFFLSKFIVPSFLDIDDRSFCSYQVYDTIGTLIRKNEHMIPNSVNNVGRTPVAQLTQFNKQLLMFNLYRDTVYKVDNNFEQSPYMILERGSVELEFEDRFERRKNSISNSDKYLMFIRERGSITLFAMNSEPESVSLFYDHEKNSLFQFENNGLLIEDEPFGIENDLDGGPRLYFHHTTHGNYGYSIIQAIDLIKWKESGSFDRLEPKYPNKKRELFKLIDSLDEEDNPVIMKVKFKEI